MKLSRRRGKENSSLVAEVPVAAGRKLVDTLGLDLEDFLSPDGANLGQLAD